MITYVLTRHLQPSQTFVVNEIDELRRQGVEVQVVSLERGAVEVQDVVYLGDLARPRRRVLGENLRAALLHPPRYARFLARCFVLRSEMGRGPDRVRWWLLPRLRDSLAQTTWLHAHFAWSGAAAADLLAALTGLPWSVTLHANDIFNEQRNLHRKLADASELVTVCRYNEDWMREHLGLTRRVLQVVCGVEVPEAPWPRLGDADVVSVGRLVEKKGLDTLVRAADLLREDHPSLQVDIIGEGPCRGELEAVVAELGLQQHVRLLGARPHEESLARIAGARVFALPCRVAVNGDRDSMPVVIKEAMIRNVPVVASDAVAVPEMLEAGCGLMVPPDQPRALAEAIGRVLSEPGLGEALAARARARALERFTLTGEVSRLRRLFVHHTGPSPLQERPA